MLVNHDREKLINAILYFAQNTQYLGKIKLFKLLYLLDFEHFRQTGRSVTGLDYSAWKYGPVPVDLYQEWDCPNPDLETAIDIKPRQIIRYVREEVLPRAEFDDSHFTKREIRLMESLAEQYRDVHAPTMIDIAHAENGAWAKVWRDGCGSNQVIDYALAIPDDDPYREDVLEAAREYKAVTHSAGF